MGTILSNSTEKNQPLPAPAAVRIVPFHEKNAPFLGFRVIRQAFQPL